MNRYFIEVSYNGSSYAGFQVQENAHTVQAELEKVMGIIFRSDIKLTGSSRTDAGVHALQNYFHFDTELEIRQGSVYNLNALLPGDLAVKNILPVAPGAHSRFDAVSREYRYHLYAHKDPFLLGRAYYFPYQLDMTVMRDAASLLMEYHDFTSFSKRNTQVRTFNCTLLDSRWEVSTGGCTYFVKGNRFLRGMVRALTGTMLRLGRGKGDLRGFRSIIEARDCTQADFSVPPHGLYLERVNYPEGYFRDSVIH